MHATILTYNETTGCFERTSGHTTAEREFNQLLFAHDTVEAASTALESWKQFHGLSGHFLLWQWRDDLEIYLIRNVEELSYYFCRREMDLLPIEDILLLQQGRLFFAERKYNLFRDTADRIGRWFRELGLRRANRVRSQDAHIEGLRMIDQSDLLRRMN